ncbi:hypothetical protein LEP1GSC016_3170 [Leptospira borgpetersenii serovar Hardjo-bovis str. Sponselee]|uniref:Uncharacterized protein n=1 Tax=Leptospira borgpetersenii serovar Hardjo-bovis str. Sponselee TaxID=1303729 RepID=M6BPS6_LEPBO|nr:hypothetical protein LEP1GSC016_3170 [Leptospira borgpetersenii serovar Hardjo-bovis str. Sponselee]
MLSPQFFSLSFLNIFQIVNFLVPNLKPTKFDVRDLFDYYSNA